MPGKSSTVYKNKRPEVSTGEGSRSVTLTSWCCMLQDNLQCPRHCGGKRFHDMPVLGCRPFTEPHHEAVAVEVAEDGVHQSPLPSLHSPGERFARIRPRLKWRIEIKSIRPAVVLNNQLCHSLGDI
jgi:hypothetical protein